MESGAIVGAVLIALTAIAAIFTVIDTPRRWWKEIISRRGTKTNPPRPNVSPSPCLSPKKITSSDPVTLRQALAAAKSLDSSHDHDRAIRIVAEMAVMQGDYKTAIEAGNASISVHAQGETLSFVALEAAKQGLFITATKAAGDIIGSHTQGATMIKVLELKRKRATVKD